ncbi:MAG: hypothetical protein HOP19_03300 [Acidobacteria bacterium]|nr:hypothetical protein [Acidobacteriota bacterium]
MKDRTNEEKPVLGSTVNGLGSMYRSLTALHEEVYPHNPAWFATMAQGYVKHMRDLLDDLEWLMEDMTPQPLREKESITENKTASAVTTALREAA